MRQVLQSATEQTVAALEIFAAHHYNMVTKSFLYLSHLLTADTTFRFFRNFIATQQQQQQQKQLEPFSLL